MADNPGPTVNVSDECPSNGIPNIANNNSSRNIGNGGSTVAPAQPQPCGTPAVRASTSTSNEIDVYYRRRRRMSPMHNRPPGRDRSRQSGNGSSQSLIKDTPQLSFRAWGFGDGDAYGGVANLGKWYEWTAYYVPILEWLPQYKCSPPLHIKACFVGVDVDSSSALYFEGLVCWIDVGQHINSHVTFLRCVPPLFPCETPPKQSCTCPLMELHGSNLAKIRPINGLYATIAAPIVYALLGKTRRLAVLPEAALSLVVGEAIRQTAKENRSAHPNIGHASEMACLITFLAACITLLAGIFRLGFVDIIGSPVLPPQV